MVLLAAVDRAERSLVKEVAWNAVPWGPEYHRGGSRYISSKARAHRPSTLKAMA